MERLGLRSKLLWISENPTQTGKISAAHLMSRSFRAFMKRTLIYTALVLVVYYSCSAADESESLKKILQSSITPGELHEDILTEQLKTWSGIRTLDGVAAVYDRYLDPNNPWDTSGCLFIQKHFEVPPDQVAGFLLERARQNAGDPLVLDTYMYFLEAYGDDPRVPRYYASLLDDKRRLTKKTKPQDQIGSTARVCDAARLNLDRWLERRGLIKSDDPGNANSALFDAERDREIRDIKPVLIKAGIMDAASTRGSGESKEATGVPSAQSNVASVQQASPRKPLTTTMAHDAAPESHGWLVWLFVVIAATIGAAWLLVRRSKP